MTVLPGWYVALSAGLLGAVLGSFLNVCIYRWPKELSVVRPRSRCGSCGTPVAAYDNIPLVSWLVLRGRCRHCRAPISVQYPLIELATALIWAFTALHHGASLETLRVASFLTIMLGIAMTDVQEMVIPDQFSLGGTALGLLLAAPPGGFPLGRALLGAVLGFVLLWGVKLAAEKALGKPALGVGDIHMMACVGAFTGPVGVILTLMLGSFLGLVIGVPVMALRGKLAAMKTYLPLGVFLALGAAIALLWGPALVEWYLGLVLAA